MRRWRALNKQFPGLAAATALMSCEEAVRDVTEYVVSGETPEAVAAAEKEHVMVGVQVTLGGRPCVLLADPGYHVARIVTVMADRAYPHTGWFTQSDEVHCRKEYQYQFNALNSGYVEWQERATRPTTTSPTSLTSTTNTSCTTSLVHVARPYLAGVNVTERRNLVYNFKSLLARDQKGRLVAGLYFPVGAVEPSFTLFLDRPADYRKTKYKFSLFAHPDQLPAALLEEVSLCNGLMNYEEGELLRTLCTLSRVLSCRPFIDQMLEINDDICRFCL